MSFEMKMGDLEVRDGKMFVAGQDIGIQRRKAAAFDEVAELIGQKLEREYLLSTVEQQREIIDSLTEATDAHTEATQNGRARRADRDLRAAVENLRAAGKLPAREPDEGGSNGNQDEAEGPQEPQEPREAEGD